MVRDLAQDEELAERVDKRIAERTIIDNLMALRTSLRLSQKDIAAKMECTQSRISKLENGKDYDLRLGDFHAYAHALGLEMVIVLIKQNRTIVDDIKYHALSIRRLFLQLTKLAEKDRRIAEGVRTFIAGEATYNITKILLEAAEKVSKESAATLPPLTTPPIQLEIRDAAAHEVHAR